MGPAGSSIVSGKSLVLLETGLYKPLCFVSQATSINLWGGD